MLDDHKQTSRPYFQNHMRSVLQSISYVEDCQKLLTKERMSNGRKTNECRPKGRVSSKRQKVQEKNLGGHSSRLRSSRVCFFIITIISFVLVSKRFSKSYIHNRLFRSLTYEFYKT